MTTDFAGDGALSRGAVLFRGLADPTRLSILAQLAAGERRVVDLTKALDLAQGTVSGHLACLRDCGLIVGRAEGRAMFYSLAHHELLDLLGAAEQLLALTGEAVALCPNFGRRVGPGAVTTGSDQGPGLTVGVPTVSNDDVS